MERDKGVECILVVVTASALKCRVILSWCGCFFGIGEQPRFTQRGWSAASDEY